MEELLNAIHAHCLGENVIEEDQKIRLEEVVDYAKYCMRLISLSAAEKKDFANCMEGYPITDKQMKLLAASSEEKKDYYIDMWARSTYFKQCAWMSYLHGETDDSPYQSEF